jgi:predicted O-methyltransferase YrrM
MNTNEITLRQLFTAVVEGKITPAMQAKAKAEIAKLDATNAKRAEKVAEKAKGNLPLKNAIFEFLVANGTKTTAEVAKGVGESTPKASAMLRQMVEEGRLTSCEVSVKGKGKQKAYTAIRSDEMGEDDPVQATDYELNTMY